VWTDVIAPARAKGYQRIWIAGISMGGLGAVAIALTIRPPSDVPAALLSPSRAA